MFGKRGDETQTGQVALAGAPPAGQPMAGHPAAGAQQQVPNLPPMQPAAGQVPQQPAAAPQPAAPQPPVQPQMMPAQNPEQKKSSKSRSDDYYDIKTTIFNALIDAIDLTQLSQLDRDAARDEIRDIVNEIIALKDVVMSIAEQEELLEDICNDVLGYGPLEPLLARDDIADIMVNGADTTYIEVDGKMETTGIRFRDNQQLMNIC